MRNELLVELNNILKEEFDLVLTNNEVQEIGTALLKFSELALKTNTKIRQE